jgi:DNA-binding MarR family transcriptional regulator
MAKTNPDTYLNIPLGKLCSMVTKPYYGALILKMEHLKIEKNFSVLILLEENKNCTQQFISCALQIDKVSMVKIIDEFTKKGLVKRVQNPKDRREYFVELTPKAYKTLPKIHMAIKGLNDIAFKDFTQKERAAFNKAIIKVYHNVKHFPSSHVIVYKQKKRTKT